MQKQLGLSTIAVMLCVVVAIMVALFLLPSYLHPQQANIQTAKHDLQTIMNALNSYKSDNTFYPSDDQGLDALVHEPHIAPIPQNWSVYLQQLPTDPWGNDYQYENINGEIRVWSYGTSGKPEGNTTIELHGGG